MKLAISLFLSIMTSLSFGEVQHARCAAKQKDSMLGLYHHVLLDEGFRIEYGKIFKNDLWILDGSLIIRTPQGNLFSIEVYKDGYSNGKSITFENDGSVSSEMNFIKGKIHGTKLVWSAQKKLLAKELYQKGAKHGASSYYNAAGILSRELIWESGVLKKMNLYKSGKLVEILEGKAALIRFKKLVDEDKHRKTSPEKKAKCK